MYAADWIEEARRLSGESDTIHQQAVQSLKNIPNLENQLKVLLRQSSKNLSTEQSLALDVISTLHLKNVWNELVSFSEKDDSGMSYLTMVSLTDEKNHLVVKKMFLMRLSKHPSSPVAKMILIDALLRMKQPISTAVLRLLLDEKSTPEVRSAALYYIRGMWLAGKNRDNLVLLKSLQGQKKHSSQFQTQLHFFLQEIESDFHHAEK